MAATITDVARRAGVSMKTVSRVLNAEPHVRDEVRQKVLSAAEELRYRPNMSARSLAGARSYVIGFLLSVFSPYMVQAQLGALKACRERGYHLLTETVDLASDVDLEIDQLSRAVSVDGVILLPPLVDSARLLDALDKAGVPYVRISPASDHGRGLYVEVDDEAAGRVMTEHLLGLGHRRIGFICGADGHGASAKRLKGYRDAMEQAGVPVEPGLIQPGAFTYETGLQAARTLLALEQRPTAVFASNDLMACAVLARAHELGLHLPDDLSVAGFDDIPSASMVWPTLTTMRQPVVDMAAAATELIIGRGGPGAAADEPRAAFSCELIVRGSTAPPRAPPR